jgi:hypothetical protein
VTAKPVVLDPFEGMTEEVNAHAPRLDTLDGKVIGLYANTKYKAVELLDLVELELRSRFDLRGVVRGSYDTGRLMEKAEWRDIERCDAIVLTHGD